MLTRGPRAGNVCISLALNLQKLAHTRLSKEAHDQDHRSGSAPSIASTSDSTAERSPLLAYHPRPHINTSVSDPLLSNPTTGTHHVLVPITGVPNGRLKNVRRRNASRTRYKARVDKVYLRSRLWWTGLMLLNLGELGNFTACECGDPLIEEGSAALISVNFADAFSPASLVAPLGTVAL